MIGHNKPSFDEVVADSIRRGLLLTIKDAYQALSRDPRAEKRHFRVMAEIIECMNLSDDAPAQGLAWPGRKRLVQMTVDDMRPDGYSEATIAKTIQELIAWGYIVQDRRPPVSGGRPLSHYSIGKPSVEDLQAEISAWVRKQRGDDNRRPFPARNGERPLSVNENGERALSVKNSEQNQKNRFNGERPLFVNGNGERPLSVTEEIKQKQQDNGNGERPLSGERVIPTVSKDNSYILEAPKFVPEAPAEEDAPATRKQGKRLPDNWVLPDEWRLWTLNNFRVTDAEITREARKFANYWIAQPGARARKLDWFRTWQNWTDKPFGRLTRAYASKGETLFDAQAANSLRDAYRAVRDGDAEL